MKHQMYFILSMIIFGAVGVFAKYIDLTSSEIALFMSLIGGLFLLLVCICAKHKPSWQNMKTNAIALLIASIALSGNWIFLFQSYKETTIANAALSYYFAPVLVILLAPFVLNEKLSFKKIGCVALALFGLFLIMLSSKTGTTEHHLLGIFYGLIAAYFYAVLTLVNKFIRDMKGLENTGDSVVMMLVLGILHGGVGFYLFFSGMGGLKGQSIAVLCYVDPLTSLMISALTGGKKCN